MKRIIFSLFMLCVSTSLSFAATAPPSTEPPPVKKVVLYKHGMGYIERVEKVRDNATLSLAFRADQMKDLLKSFFAVDLGGGKISSVRYETADPISKQLQDILITVPEQAALSQFLAQLKGARLSVKASGETIEGRILGIEPINEVVGGQSVQKGHRLVVLTDSGAIRSPDLSSVSELTLTDEALQRDLRRLLDLTLEGRHTNRKTLTVSAVGKGERDILIGYLIEMPIWKCSYRVIFDEKKKDSPPLLQGWAMAENTTEDDWKDVTISFVAGNPLSFLMDLYSPYYVRRVQTPIPGLPDLTPDWTAASPPDSMEMMRKEEIGAKGGKARAGAPSKAARGLPGAVAQSMDQAGFGAAPPPAPAQVQPARPMGELLASSYGEEAQGAKIGELFSYEAKEKISIPRGQAAMAPILAKQINGRRLLYYKESFSPKVANAFVLRNDTEVTLEAGPVTFFEAGTSLGESILGHTLPPGSQEILPYAMDASVDITPQKKSKREPHFKGRLVDGILTLTCVETLTNTWKIVNRGKESAVLWLNQPKNVDYRLSKPEKPLKEVDRHYRFEVPLKAGETTEFTVEEKRDVLETVYLANIAEEQVRFYASQRYMSPAAKKFMTELGDLMAKKAALQRRIDELTQQAKRLTEEQGRLRSNLGSLRSDVPKEQELRAKWVASLSADEDRLTECRSKLDEAGENLRKMEETLAAKIREHRDE